VKNHNEMRKIAIILCIGFLIISCDRVEPLVKKSKTGICHKAGTRYYDQTKYFEKFSSIEDCIKSGGRLPKRR
tara:strand:- start:48 stop:266 length:219 start_codon:yes stop_codon:yes gene_type:complete